MASLAVAERRKYEAMWKRPEYRAFSPGEWLVDLFFNKQVFGYERVQVFGYERVIDVGCGTGRAAVKIHNEYCQAVTCMDFVDAREGEARKLPFIKQNIWRAWTPGDRYHIAYCCDVLEHIPPERIDDVMRNIMKHCINGCFSVHFGEDACGQLIGERLHLTIQPFTWWLAKFREYGEVTNARDLIGMGVFSVQFR